MIEIRKTTNQDIDKILDARYETIRVVCNLDENYIFSEEFKNNTEKYYLTAEQTTVLALDNETVVGCATLCYLSLMPTFDHPDGKRGHIMNVYTKEKYRRQGIGYQMINTLIEDARENGATELSLDATMDGRLLYEKCGFVTATKGMVLNLKKIIET